MVPKTMWHVAHWGRFGYTIGNKLFLEEITVETEIGNLVWISIDMGSIVSPKWEYDHAKKFSIS